MINCPFRALLLTQTLILCFGYSCGVMTSSINELSSLHVLSRPEGKCDRKQRELEPTPFSQGLSEFPPLFLLATSEVWSPAGNKTRWYHHPGPKSKRLRDALWPAKTHKYKHSCRTQGVFYRRKKNQTSFWIAEGSGYLWIYWAYDPTVGFWVALIQITSHSLPM